MATSVLTYPSPSTGQSLEQLQAALQAAIEAGESRVILDLDRLEVLDSGTIRHLITLLRRAREERGEIALHATRPELLRTLSVTALDKIFQLVSELPEAA